MQTLYIYIDFVLALVLAPSIHRYVCASVCMLGFALHQLLMFQRLSVQPHGRPRDPELRPRPLGVCGDPDERPQLHLQGHQVYFHQSNIMPLWR